jgi:Fe-S oxidoreductase
LEAAGFEVVVPPRRCCGRPALSQGLIDIARRDMRTNVRLLSPYARHGVPIVVPEPSCASAFRDEMPDLLRHPEESDDATAVASAVTTLDEFVAGLTDERLSLIPGPERAVLHVHCHQRVATGPEPSVSSLSRIPGLEVEEPDAGCCGMAGSFGYEAEHYDLSIAMAERRLAPAIRAALPSTAVVAPGASCRHQILDTTGRRAVHPIELIAEHLAESTE